MRLLGLLSLASTLGLASVARAFPVITEPTGGAVVPAEFTVKVTYGDLPVGDTDGTGETPTETVRLSADDVTLAECDTKTQCPGGQATFAVGLAPGMHTLKAEAFAYLAYGSSDPVAIVVEDAPAVTGTDGAGEGSSDDGSTGDGTGDSSKDGGCGCREAPCPAGALASLVVPCLRRRPRRIADAHG